MSDYDKFAKQYSDSMSEEGDYFHQTQIDPYIYSIIGNPKDKLIYDIGCGNGYMARNLAKKGARVYASDISKELIAVAEEKSKGLNIRYSVHDATDFSSYQNQQFDIVVMNMVIHYIKDLNKLFKGISETLKDGGVFVFSTNHFFRPSYPYSEWVAGKVNGEEKLFIKVTGYLEKRATEIESGWDKKTKLTIDNHPLNELVNTMSKHHLLTFRVEEPESVGFAKDFPENLRDSHHIPTFMIVGAKKDNSVGD
jgi:2-polyprenyl-3-methyl-5-hydroxy-6-metoxy-1,4-benzoquinol methylase